MPRRTDFDDNRPQLPGKLNQPIQLPAAPGNPLLASSALLSENSQHSMQVHQKDVEEWWAHAGPILMKARTERFIALNKIYKDKGVNTDDWAALCTAIIDDFIPAFEVRIGDNRGPKQKWTSVKLLRLFLAVNRKREELKRIHPDSTPAVSTACKALTKELEWRDEEMKTLQHRYTEAESSPFVVIYKNALACAANDDKKKEITATFGALK